jgi:shikimate kinase
LNSWINEKSNPRAKAVEKIDILYLELTGQNIIPDSELEAKKQLIFKKAENNQNILNIILNRKDLYEQFLVSLTYNTNSIE